MVTLANYLKSKNETQAHFAARVGMTQGNVAKLCGENPKISLETALRIEDATGGVVTVETWPHLKVLVRALADRHAQPVAENSP